MATKTVLLSTTGAASWTIPSDCDVNGFFEGIAIAGGAGGSRSTNGGTATAFSGGGGALALCNLSLVGLVAGVSAIFLSVAAAGVGATASNGTGTLGGDTWFNKSTNAAPTLASNGALAKGAPAASANTGGSAASSVGDLKVGGGLGNKPAGTGSGAGGNGGGSAGSLYVGGNAGLGATGTGDFGGGGAGGTESDGATATTINGANGGNNYLGNTGGAGGAGAGGSGSNGGGGAGGAGINTNSATAFAGGAGGPGIERFIGTTSGTDRLTGTSPTLGTGMSGSAGSYTATAVANFAAMLTWTGPLTAGVRYRLKFAYTSSAPGTTIQVSDAGGSNNYGFQKLSNASGTIIVDFLATSANLVISNFAGGAFSGTITSISCEDFSSFTSSAGAGGGGGGGGGSNNTSAIGGVGGAAANYGGGGGSGGNAATSGNGGNGAQGAILFTYTVATSPASLPPMQNALLPLLAR